MMLKLLSALTILPLLGLLSACASVSGPPPALYPAPYTVRVRYVAPAPVFPVVPDHRHRRHPRPARSADPLSPPFKPLTCRPRPPVPAPGASDQALARFIVELSDAHRDCEMKVQWANKLLAKRSAMR